jgi:hypothetical protein
MGKPLSFCEVGSEFYLVIRYISGFKNLNKTFIVLVPILYVNVKFFFFFLHSTPKSNLCILCDT